MKIIMFRIGLNIAFKIINTSWILLRPILYLYLVWVGMRITSLFN